ncbi:hypothetical protein AB1Y20_003352 [Prymnesium parvum]|uniref:Uncharacterized protein n=1 Tax=Prymnesium parvum TaxID=97485 RepID=A0AB34JDY6_PRYPA
MAPSLHCRTDPSHGLQTKALFLATVTGRDSCAIALSSMVNALGAHRVRGYTASAGWLHLSEFAQRWIELRRKMTEPSNPDFEYFSQFRRHPRDGFPSSSPDSDFRSLDELLRRRIKPAWFQVFNLSSMLCGVRSLLVDALQPASEPDSVALLHAFSLSEETTATNLRKLAHPDDSASSILSSLRLFLTLFPRGKVIIHLPFPPPRAGVAPPHCACPATSRCVPLDGEAAAWPAPRAQVTHTLLQLRTTHAARTLVTVASRDFANFTRLAERLADFLDSPRPRGGADGGRGGALLRRWEQKRNAAVAVMSKTGARSFSSLGVRLRREELGLQLTSRAEERGVGEEGLEARMKCRVAEARGERGFACPKSRCTDAQAEGTADSRRGTERGLCTQCRATLAEWGWQHWWRRSQIAEA